MNLSKLGSVGGTGGNNKFTCFEVGPRSGTKMFHIKVWCADRIDRIQCARLTPGEGKGGGGVSESREHGGNGGSLKEFHISDNDYLTKVEGTLGFVNGIGDTIHSLQFSTKMNKKSELFGKRTGGFTFSFECPEGHHIVNFNGRYGYEMDYLEFEITKIQN